MSNPTYIGWLRTPYLIKTNPKPHLAPSYTLLLKESAYHPTLPFHRTVTRKLTNFTCMISEGWDEESAFPTIQINSGQIMRGNFNCQPYWSQHWLNYFIHKGPSSFSFTTSICNDSNIWFRKFALFDETSNGYCLNTTTIGPYYHQPTSPFCSSVRFWPLGVLLHLLTAP